MQQSMKNIIRRISMKHVCVASIAIIASCFFAITARADIDTFAIGTTINSYDVSGMTASQARDLIQAIYDNDYQIQVVQDGGRVEIIKGDDIGLIANVPLANAKALLQQQKTTGVVTNFYLESEIAYNAQALADRIFSLYCVSDSSLIRTVDAGLSIYVSGKAYTITSERQGNDADPQLIMQLLAQVIHGTQTRLDVRGQGGYKTVAITRNDSRLKESLAKANSIRNMSITLTIGADTITLTADDICKYIQGTDANGALVIDEDAIRAYVQSLSDTYSTNGRLVTFRTAEGTDVQVMNYVGWTMNVEAETIQLIAMINAGVSTTHDVGKPVSDWGSSYVEIDKTKQVVYFIADGIAIWAAHCVTGNERRGWGTPTGAYAVYAKQTNRVLRGAGYASPVKYWMPFNGGIGLHDASWRSSFGGEIYKTAGSHGCINLPKDTVATLYALVQVGTKVIVHD